MPLNAQKAQHILQVVARSFVGRQRTVVIVYLASGVYTYSAVTVIMRAEQVPDPQVSDVSGRSAPRTVDTIMIAPLGTNFTGAVYVADTPTATQAAVSSARKYEIIDALSVGIVPGGSHIRVLLRRLQ